MLALLSIELRLPFVKLTGLLMPARRLHADKLHPANIVAYFNDILTHITMVASTIVPTRTVCRYIFFQHDSVNHLGTPFSCFHDWLFETKSLTSEESLHCNFYYTFYFIRMTFIDVV